MTSSTLAIVVMERAAIDTTLYVFAQFVAWRETLLDSTLGRRAR